MTSQTASSRPGPSSPPPAGKPPAKRPPRVQKTDPFEDRFVPNLSYNIISPSPSPPPSPSYRTLNNKSQRFIVPYTGRALANRAVANRPRIRDTWRRWPSYARGRPHRFENPGTLCYRNASLAFLLASPPLFNWSAAHVRGSAWTCLIRNCLVCSFHNLATEYWQDDNEGNVRRFDARTFDTRAREFWDLCLRVFWGPRARMKNKLGPIDVNKEGSSNIIFTLWLMHAMREQVQARPSEVKTFKRIFHSEVRTQPKCSSWKCPETQPATYSDGSYMIFAVNLKKAKISYLLSRALRAKSQPKTLCVSCAGLARLTYEVSYFNAAENLILDVGIADRPDCDYPVVPLEETISLPVHEKAKVDYALTAVMWLNPSGIGHSWTIFKAKDNKLYDSDIGREFGSWQEVSDKLQNGKEAYKAYPQMFLYTLIDGGADTPQIITTTPRVAKRPRSPTSTSSSGDSDRSASSTLVTKLFKMRLRSDDQKPPPAKRPATEKPPLDLISTVKKSAASQQDFIISTFCAAFNQVSRTRMRKILQRHAFNPDEAYFELVYGEESPKFPPRYTMDTLPLLQLGDVLKTLAVYPERSIDEVVDALEECHWSVENAVLKLESNRKLDLWHSETVGTAEIMNAYEIAPSDALGVPALMSETLNVKGNVTYKLNGKTWYGGMWGKLWRTDV